MKIKHSTNHDQAFFTAERCSIIEILNSTEVKNISLAQTTVKPGITTANHTLKDTDEIYYILSGEGIATIDGKTYSVKKGDALHIPKNISQFIYNPSSEDLVFLCICNPRFDQSCYISNE